MCIAILNPNDVTLKKKVLQTCWDNNKDGAGLLYLNKGVLTTHKEMTDFDKFFSHYLKVRKEHADSQVVIHFRISTHGKIDLENCHPFVVNKEWGFVHNGIISNVARHKDFSDTNMFNRHILQKLPHDWIHNDAIYELVTGYIGSSKLLFLNTNNDAYIINEEAGVWDMGCWFSNTTYKQSRMLDVGGRSVSAFGGGSKLWWEEEWERKYKWNPQTKSYDKIEEEQTLADYEEDSVNPWRSTSSWNHRDYVYEDECESCLNTTECMYDDSYHCSICKTCANELHGETVF